MVMDDFFERISHPALTDLRMAWDGMQVSEVFPDRMPDVFVGRPVILTGRFNGGGHTTVRVVGNAAGRPVELAIPAKLDDPAATHRGLPGVWARGLLYRPTRLKNVFVCDGFQMYDYLSLGVK